MNPRGAVIVTGGSRGIGAAVAKAVAAQGFPVVVNFQRNESAATETVRAITGSGGRAVALRADVSKEDDVMRLFAAAEREFLLLYGLVNSAGITGGFARVEKVSAATVQSVLQVNVAGTMLCCREAVKRMSTVNGASGGAIVNISSLAARIGGGGEWVHYAASKGAINTLTIGLAREVASEGIRVNCVAPGHIATEIHAAAGVPDRMDRVKGTIPMQRPGTAEEVAAGVLWLLSPEASYVTGTILEVGGGR
jgi:NAD(P)-dependent dehydrogenase (short-subunit alcohol dehydrogenase family)